MSEPTRDPPPKRKIRISISRQRMVEFTVVVLGVLVALGLENLVQEARYRGDARDLERALVADLRSSVVHSLERQAVTPCLAQRLGVLWERVDGATGVPEADGLDERSGFGTPQLYRAPTRLWVTSSFDRALGSEAFKRIPPDRAEQYARIFAQISAQHERNLAEFDATAGVAALSINLPDMNSEVRADLVNQIAVLDRQQYLMGLASIQIVEAIFAVPVIGEEIRIALRDGVPSNVSLDFAALSSRLKTNYGDCADLTVYDRLNTPITS